MIYMVLFLVRTNPGAAVRSSRKSTKPHEDKSLDDEASTCSCLDVREI